MKKQCIIAIGMLIITQNIMTIDQENQDLNDPYKFTYYDRNERTLKTVKGLLSPHKVMLDELKNNKKFRELCINHLLNLGDYRLGDRELLFFPGITPVIPVDKGSLLYPFGKEIVSYDDLRTISRFVCVDRDSSELIKRLGVNVHIIPIIHSAIKESFQSSKNNEKNAKGLDFASSEYVIETAARLIEHDKLYPKVRMQYEKGYEEIISCIEKVKNGESCHTELMSSMNTIKYSIDQPRIEQYVYFNLFKIAVIQKKLWEISQKKNIKPSVLQWMKRGIEEDVIDVAIKDGIATAISACILSSSKNNTGQCGFREIQDLIEKYDIKREERERFNELSDYSSLKNYEVKPDVIYKKTLELEEFLENNNKVNL